MTDKAAKLKKERRTSMTKVVLAKVVSVAASAVVFAAGWLAAPARAASDAMPAAQQTALVQKYCAVCHTDGHLNGGLSFEHFDAGHPDPGVVAMIISKLKGGAMGAAGIPMPEKATQDALLSALGVEAAGADRWFVNRAQRRDQSEDSIVTASVTREVPSPTYAKSVDTYRLTLTCRPDNHTGAAVLAWAPGVPKKGTAFSAGADGKAPSTYTVELNENELFTGATGNQGQGAMPMHMTSLPEQTLTITDVFPGETVVFPFGELTSAMRQELSPCFSTGN
jgi:mono/diheme cytochrome c family protein